MIGAGGTGGHVYPALVAAAALRQRAPDAVDLVFVGTVGGVERPLVEQSTIPFKAYHEVMAGPVHGVNPLRAISSLLKFIVGVVQSLWLVLRYRPKAMLLTGGWANVPLAVAAWLLRTPVMVYLPDIEPGLTINVLKRFARKVAITVPDSEVYFRPGQTVVTGYPLRESVLNATREVGIAYFNLDPDRKTICVMGGSSGSRNINIALVDILPDLLAEGVQVIHITGKLDWPRVQEQVKSLDTDGRYHVFPYIHEMGLVLAAADIVVCRSGASTLGEIPYFGLAAILVPYPYAWRYQKVNADYLADRGAAIHMADERMTDDLLPALRQLLHNPAELAQYQAHAKSLSRDDGAVQLAQELMKLAGGAAW